MHFTLVQVIGIFIAIWIAWWAIKHLFATYAINFLSKKRMCLKCLNRKGSVVLNSPWTVKTADKIPMYLCNKCKNLEFPGEVGEFAQKRGFLVKELE